MGVGMNNETDIRLILLGCRVHALEEVLLKLHPDKKEELSECFMRHSTEILDSFKDLNETTKQEDVTEKDDEGNIEITHEEFMDFLSDNILNISLESDRKALLDYINRHIRLAWYCGHGCGYESGSKRNRKGDGIDVD